MEDLRGARAELIGSFGPGRSCDGWAPGRCTLVGEHVDYAGGVVACVAIELGVAAAVRPSPDGVWRVSSRGRRVERTDPSPAGDIGDRVFAAALALREEGLEVPPLEAGLAASLPASAGLSSSAALVCAMMIAILRLTGGRLEPGRLATCALRAERDLAGIPVGPLDHRAVIHAPAHGVIVLDCLTGASRTVPWPWTDVVLVACDTGIAHDVGGSGYRARRAEVEAGLRRLGRSHCRGLEPSQIERAPLTGVEARRLRHVVTETARTGAAEAAIIDGDAALLGTVMNASHASLRDDHEVSMALLDAVVSAAVGSPGVFGARLVGAGFGGSGVALASEAGAAGCAMAMALAAGEGARTWVLRPAPGLAARAPDVLRRG